MTTATSATVDKAERLSTPLQTAYQSTLAGLPKGTLLLWRLGDFYEIFGDGAKIAAPVLNVALTKRNGIAMAGIPVHAQETYLGKLTSSGHTVALATQDVSAITAQGIKVEMRRPPAPQDYPYGTFLTEQAAHPACTLSELHAMACGAYSACTTLAEFESVQANLERAKAMLETREVQP